MGEGDALLPMHHELVGHVRRVRGSGGSSMVVVKCFELDGEQHEGKHEYDRLSLDYCTDCGYPLLWCEWCNLPASCCQCGAFHADECVDP